MNRPVSSVGYGKDPTGRTRPGRRHAAVIAAGGLAASALAALPASATVVDDSLEAGDNITVFHNIDFVALSGWADGESVTVTVQRNGVQIGTATGSASDPEATGSSGLEVNHGPEGAPLPGDCWEGSTPDIQPGDLITVTGGTDVDSVIVDDVRFTGDPRLAGDGDVVVPFVARRMPDGAAVPLSLIDSPEFRAGSRLRFEATDIQVQRSGSGVAGEYVMRYNAPFTPSRNRDLLNQRQLRTLLLGDGHAIGFGHTDPLPLEAMLHDGLADTPGPAPGCEEAPSARWAVNSVSPATVNLSNRTSNVVVRGVADGATAVTARLSDRDGTVIDKAATLSGGSWNASFPPGELGQLNGTIKVEGLYTMTTGGQIGGLTKTITKDVVAPGTPRASLRSGTYRRPKLLRLRTGAANTIRYTLGRGGQAAPTRLRGLVYKRAIRISTNQTVKAVAIDPAGNVSRLIERRFRIR